MFNVFELFRQAQGGAAFDNLARAYGMSPEQMRAATTALTPAFVQGFQRRAQGDEAAQRFQDIFQTETYARAFDAHAAALDPATKAAGDDALGALFGSKEVSRAVASQAAAASGVQAEIIRKVLPVLASILVGGFMKAAQGASPQATAPGGFPGPMGEFWSQMLGGGRPAVAGSGGPQNPFQDWTGNFPKPPEGPTAETPANPMGDVMSEMLNGLFGGAAASQPVDAQTAKPSAPEAPAPGSSDPFGGVIETGRELSNQNAKAMEQIFDAFFGGSKKS